MFLSRLENSHYFCIVDLHKTLKDSAKTNVTLQHYNAEMTSNIYLKRNIKLLNPKELIFIWKINKIYKFITNFEKNVAMPQWFRQRSRLTHVPCCLSGRPTIIFNYGSRVVSVA